MPYGRSWKTALKDFKSELTDDNVFNGAAALAYYLTLAIFPAMILLLSLIPFLPIPNVDAAIMDMLKQTMPEQASAMLTDTVRGITSNRSGGLLSFGVLATLWAASNGAYAIMQQLNITYDVKEGRSFIKVRATAIGLTLLVGVLVIGAFSLIVMGGWIEGWLQSSLGWGSVITTLFALGRWCIIALALLMAFAVTYYFGPDVEQRFRFISPGSIVGSLLLVGASLAFRLYVKNFSNYNATYGSIGAVIVLMLWLYITGLVVLAGSEINSLVEHYSPKGKQKGEKEEPQPRIAA